MRLERGIYSRYDYSLPLIQLRLFGWLCVRPNLYVLIQAEPFHITRYY